MMKLVGLALTSLLALLMAPALAKESCQGDIHETGDLKLTFKSGPITYDQLVDRPKVLEAPTLKMNADVAEPGKQVLVVMVDPDAPNLAECTFWLHWIISGTFTQNGTLSKISTHVSYFPPTPPRNTGSHRYQVLVYKMMDGVTIPFISLRANFPLENTIKHLMLGTAVASTQFRVKNP